MHQARCLSRRQGICRGRRPAKQTGGAHHRRPPRQPRYGARGSDGRSTPDLGREIKSQRRESTGTKAQASTRPVVILASPRAAPSYGKCRHALHGRTSAANPPRPFPSGMMEPRTGFGNPGPTSMGRLQPLLMFAWLAACPTAFAADLSKVDRILTKEPAYRSKPRYCVLVFGPEAKTRRLAGAGRRHSLRRSQRRRGPHRAWQENPCRETRRS